MPFHTKVPERAIHLYEILQLWLEWLIRVVSQRVGPFLE